MDKPYSQQGWVITHPIECGLEYLIHSLTLTLTLTYSVEVWECIRNFTPHIKMNVVTYARMLGLALNHVCKRGCKTQTTHTGSSNWPYAAISTTNQFLFVLQDFLWLNVKILVDFIGKLEHLLQRLESTCDLDVLRLPWKHSTFNYWFVALKTNEIQWYKFFRRADLLNIFLLH